MKPEDAIKLLIEAVNLAQARGAYNLKESATILPAVETFNNKQEKNMYNEEVKSEVVEETPVVESIPNVDEGPVEDTESAPVEVSTEEVVV